MALNPEACSEPSRTSKMELFSKNCLGKAPLFASNIFNIIKKPFTLCTNTNIHKVVYSIGRISELRYLE